MRTDEDNDVKTYIHTKQLDVVKIQLGHAFARVRDAFLKVASIPINELVNQACFYTRNVATVRYAQTIGCPKVSNARVFSLLAVLCLALVNVTAKIHHGPLRSIKSHKSKLCSASAPLCSTHGTC